MTDQSVPLLVRPIPRRPFLPAFSSPTPPPDPGANGDDALGLKSTARFLQTFNTDAAISAPATPSSPALSRSGSSFFNLTLNLAGMGLGSASSNSFNNSFSQSKNTSSTLGGIFSPSMTSMDRFFDDSVPSSPWENGSQSPIWRQGIDDSTYEVIKKRSGLRYQHCNGSGIDATTKPIDTNTNGATESEPSSGSSNGIFAWFSEASLPLRIAILFVLGAAYGNMVSGRNSTRTSNSLPRQILDWEYLMVWGCIGIACGVLFRCADAVWDLIFREAEDEPMPSEIKTHGHLSQTASPDTLKEWALVVRSIAAFVGIVFAIVSLSSIMLIGTSRLLV
ncbi:Insulin-induced protein (INSIG) [Ceratocystis lukuohia]